MVILLFILFSAPGLVCAEQPTVDGTELVISWSYNHTGGLNVTMTLVEYRAESSQNFIPLPSYMDMSGSGGPPLYSGSDSGLLLDTSASLPLPTAGVLYFFRVIASNEAGSTTVECPSVLTSIGTTHPCITIHVHVYFASHMLSHSCESPIYRHSSYSRRARGAV